MFIIKKKKKIKNYSGKTVKKRLFQAFTAVLGRSYAEKGSTDTTAYWETI